VYGLKHQKEKRSMDHFAGLDVSVKETSVCIVDDTGKIVREVKVASEPEALLAVLKNSAYHFKRIGLEAGPLSQWLFSALAEAELPVVCVETRHMQALLKAQINKTDRNDARGIAQMMRVGLYRPVHVKTLRCRSRKSHPLDSRDKAESAHHRRDDCDAPSAWDSCRQPVQVAVPN
jgi:transposase